jgi:hypothetical protein
MNPEIKAQWVAALRSGDYEQGDGILHYIPEHGGDEFCCLGVLCDIAVKSGVDIRVLDEEEGDVRFGTVMYDETSELLPESVRKWAGLRYENPEIAIVNEYDTVSTSNLADLNDSGYSFADLAGWIDEQL